MNVVPILAFAVFLGAQVAPVFAEQGAPVGRWLGEGDLLPDAANKFGQSNHQVHVLELKPDNTYSWQKAEDAGKSAPLPNQKGTWTWQQTGTNQGILTQVCKVEIYSVGVQEWVEEFKIVWTGPNRFNRTPTMKGFEKEVFVFKRQ